MTPMEEAVHAAYATTVGEQLAAEAEGLDSTIRTATEAAILAYLQAVAKSEPDVEAVARAIFKLNRSVVCTPKSEAWREYETDSRVAPMEARANEWLKNHFRIYDIDEDDAENLAHLLYDVWHEGQKAAPTPAAPPVQGEGKDESSLVINEAEGYVEQFGKRWPMNPMWPLIRDKTPHATWNTPEEAIVDDVPTTVWNSGPLPDGYYVGGILQPKDAVPESGLREWLSADGSWLAGPTETIVAALTRAPSSAQGVNAFQQSIYMDELEAAKIGGAWLEQHGQAYAELGPVNVSQTDSVRALWFRGKVVAMFTVMRNDANWTVLSLIGPSHGVTTVGDAVAVHRGKLLTLVRLARGRGYEILCDEIEALAQSTGGAM